VVHEETKAKQFFVGHDAWDRKSLS
jgi:hypothetical protein